MMFYNIACRVLFWLISMGKFYWRPEFLVLIEQKKEYNNKHSNHLFRCTFHSYSLTASVLAWIGTTRVKGANFHPSALKNLFWNYTHCRRNACRKHSIVSIPIITAKVMLNHKNIPITITIAFAPSIPPPIVFSKNTFDNWPCANDNAHRRK